MKNNTEIEIIAKTMATISVIVAISYVAYLIGRI
jgi:hypothetical protein